MNYKRRKKLSEDDVDVIRSFRGNDSYKIIFKLLDNLKSDIENRVLKMDLKSNSFADLALEKSKVDGADELINKLRRDIDDIAKLD